VDTGIVDPVGTVPSVTTGRTVMTAAAGLVVKGMIARGVRSLALSSPTADPPVTAGPPTTGEADSLRPGTSARTGTIGRGGMTSAAATAPGNLGAIGPNPPVGMGTVVRVRTVRPGTTGRGVRNRVAGTATAALPVTAGIAMTGPGPATTGRFARIGRGGTTAMAAIAPAQPGTIVRAARISTLRGATTGSAIRETGSGETCPARSMRPRRKGPLARGVRGPTGRTRGVRDRTGATVESVGTDTTGPIAIWSRGHGGSRSEDPVYGTRMSTPPGRRCRNGHRRSNSTPTCVGISAA
jgi:hypothetical protein